MRTVQSKTKTDKTAARSGVETPRKKRLDMADASLETLLALVLGRSVRVRPGMLDGVGCLASLARMAPAALVNRAGLRDNDAERLAAAFELGRRQLADVGAERYILHSAAATARWFRLQVGALMHEELWVLALDGGHSIRGARCVARGGLHGTSFSPVDVLRNGLELGASSFVLVHNHPSGDTWPSLEDAVLTVLAYNAGEIMRMPLSDHVIVGPHRTYFSFVENELMPNEPTDPKLWLKYLQKGRQ